MRRLVAATVLCIGSLVLVASPAAAGDIDPFYGPLEVRIVGANGEMRDFIALSREDTQGASVLVKQITSALPGPPQPIEEVAATLPHYRIGISHMAMSYPTMPSARKSATTFIYYPGGDGASFLMVEFGQADAVLQDRWVAPAPAVSAMIRRHLKGLAPIGTGAAEAESPSPPPWGLIAGAVLLAGLSLLFLEDRRRWRRGADRRSAGKGTDRRS